MPKGLYVLVGLKSVDPSCYGGWDGTGGCWGCELDVDNIQRILDEAGYDGTVLKTSQATRQTVLNALKKAASDLSGDDILALYFSCHGGQQPDFDSDDLDELDGKDETLLLYDGEIIDDQLNDIWLTLPHGARVVMISDSCNSGTNYKLVGDFLEPTPFLPLTDKSVEDKMKAQLIHFGGCRDGSTSDGYHGGGAFTMALCRAWDDGAFQGNYRQLIDRAIALMHSQQKPQYNEYGPVGEAFRNARPFQI